MKGEVIPDHFLMLSFQIDCCKSLDMVNFRILGSPKSKRDILFPNYTVEGGGGAGGGEVNDLGQ